MVPVTSCALGTLSDMKNLNKTLIFSKHFKKLYYKPDKPEHIVDNFDATKD